MNLLHNIHTCDTYANEAHVNLAASNIIVIFLFVAQCCADCVARITIAFPHDP